MHDEKTSGADDNRALKKRLVEEGRAHAALRAEAVAWCQYGTPARACRTLHRRRRGSADALPDYRITCIFADKKARRQGATEVALRGAVDLIQKAGGGVAEGYPNDTEDGRKVSVLYSATRAVLRAGRVQLRPS